MKKGDYYLCKKCEKTCIYFGNRDHTFPYCSKCKKKFVNSMESEEK